jgi:hypothetical protein
MSQCGRGASSNGTYFGENTNGSKVRATRIVRAPTVREWVHWQNRSLTLAARRHVWDQSAKASAIGLSVFGSPGKSVLDSTSNFATLHGLTIVPSRRRRVPQR